MNRRGEDSHKFNSGRLEDYLYDPFKGSLVWRREGDVYTNFLAMMQEIRLKSEEYLSDFEGVKVIEGVKGFFGE